MDRILSTFSPKKTPAKAVFQARDTPESTLKKRKTPSSTRRASFARKLFFPNDAEAPQPDEEEDGNVDGAQESPPQPKTATPSSSKRATPAKKPTDGEEDTSQPSALNYDEMQINMEDGDEAEGEEEGEEEEEEYSFKGFSNHRWVDNSIEIEVEWEQGGTTWEPEANLHQDAPDTLFAYWRDQGGRPANPVDPEMFEVFAILKHNKNRNRLLVEWVGFEPSEASWVPRRVIEETAGDVVAAYWESLKKKTKAKKK